MKKVTYVGDSPFSSLGYADMYLSENDTSPFEDDLLLLVPDSVLVEHYMYLFENDIAPLPHARGKGVYTSLLLCCCFGLRFPK